MLNEIHKDMSLMPQLERSPDVGNCTLLQYFCWKFLCAEEPGGLQSMGQERVGHDLAQCTMAQYI